MSRLSLAISSITIAAASFVFPAGCTSDTAGYGHRDTNGTNTGYVNDSGDAQPRSPNGGPDMNDNSDNTSNGGDGAGR